MLFDEAMDGIRAVFDNAADRTAGAIGNSKSYL